MYLFFPLLCGLTMKQHYLPQCYLKEFLNKEGKLHTIDVNLLKHKRPVLISYEQQPRYADLLITIL